MASEDNDIKKGIAPNYKISALSRKTEHRGNIGVAWLKADGSISIKLNPFVVLNAEDDLVITMFVNDLTKSYKREE